MIGMSDKQVLEHFKETLLPNKEAQLFEIHDINIAIGKARVLIILFNLELPWAKSSSMPVHMTERNDDTKPTNQANKAKPNISDEAFCKTGVDPGE